jgi:hypothetical protein
MTSQFLLLWGLAGLPCDVHANSGKDRGGFGGGPINGGAM